MCIDSNKQAGERMRKPVQEVYNRQVARCLGDIEEMNFELPSMIEERFKRAIEYACKDTDKLNKNGGRDGNTKYSAEQYNR